MKTYQLPIYGIRVTVVDGCGSIESDLPRERQIDAVLSLALAHACAGIDVSCPAYVEGVKTAIENLSNDLE